MRYCFIIQHESTCFQYFCLLSGNGKLLNLEYFYQYGDHVQQTVRCGQWFYCYRQQRPFLNIIPGTNQYVMYQKNRNMESGAAVYAVGSGTYRFQSTLPEPVKGADKWLTPMASDSHTMMAAVANNPWGLRWWVSAIRDAYLYRLCYCCRLRVAPPPHRRTRRPKNPFQNWGSRQSVTA